MKKINREPMRQANPCAYAQGLLLTVLSTWAMFFLEPKEMTNQDKYQH
jgi:hypothetical protein